MGLPLYRAPSASPPPTSKEKSPGSPRLARMIHRTNRTNRANRASSRTMTAEQLRERRRRILDRIGYVAGPDGAVPRARVIADPHPPPRGPEMGRAALRDMARGLLTDRTSVTEEERLAVHNFEPVSARREADGPERPPMIVRPSRSSDIPPYHTSAVPPPSGPYALSNMRSTRDGFEEHMEHLNSNRLRRMALLGQARSERYLLGPYPAAPIAIQQDVDAIMGRPPMHRNDDEDHTSPGSPDSTMIAPEGDDPTPPPVDAVGGLGDRNRSLSPEGDHVWDTLLSTVTPDPQPPSVGSSFASASASASAAASQSFGTAGTSGTPLTVPDGADESGLDHACETDTGGDEDAEDDYPMPGLARLVDGPWSVVTRAPRRGLSYEDAERLSYADVTANLSNEDARGLLGGIGGMLHIVRNLARREDIPDEWWAEAGLSRTLPRDDTRN